MMAGSPPLWEGKARFFVEKDLSAARKEYVFSLPQRMQAWIMTGLEDERDWPVACAMLNILLTVPPGAIILYSLRQYHLLGLIYFTLVQANFLQRYLVAVLHTTEHRRLFRRGELRSGPFNAADHPVPASLP
jgi:hypothetical protein